MLCGTGTFACHVPALPKCACPSSAQVRIGGTDQPPQAVLLDKHSRSPDVRPRIRFQIAVVRGKPRHGFDFEVKMIWKAEARRAARPMLGPAGAGHPPLGAPLSTPSSAHHVHICPVPLKRGPCTVSVSPSLRSALGADARRHRQGLRHHPRGVARDNCRRRCVSACGQGRGRGRGWGWGWVRGRGESSFCSLLSRPLPDERPSKRFSRRCAPLVRHAEPRSRSASPCPELIAALPEGDPAATRSRARSPLTFFCVCALPASGTLSRLGRGGCAGENR